MCDVDPHLGHEVAEAHSSFMTVSSEVDLKAVDANGRGMLCVFFSFFPI